MAKIDFHSRDFVHLHLHSDYSLLQSTIQLKPLVEKLAQSGMKACALTDYGNMYGAVSFHMKMIDSGLRPIIGYEALVAPEGRFGRSLSIAAGERPNYSFILLAKDLEGYRNLSFLSSKAFTEGFFHKPRIDREILATHSAGLVCISPFTGGEIGHFITSDNLRAVSVASDLREIFGEENFYLELNDCCDEDSGRVKATVEFASKNDLKLVAANNVHYLNADGARAHEVLLCIKDGRPFSSNSGFTLGSDKFYLRSAEEMWNIFGSELPASLTNTLAIAEMCDVPLDVSGENLTLPDFPIPEDAGVTDLNSYFRKVTREGFDSRDVSVWNPMRNAGTLKYSPADYEARLELELSVIEKMGYGGYFLIVWDFIKYAVEKGIPVGPGRGSAAGSLVAYCLGITGIDPLQYDLFFERFLNPERVSMPDIDIDFCIRGRGDVIQHVSELYGRDSVCQIITFGTMASKAAIKDVGRAMNMPYGDVERIAKLIPPPFRGRNVSISQALETVPELKAATETDARVKDLIDLALSLEGCNRHSSVHAAGVVISPRPLHELVPVALSSKNELTSQYSMNDLEKVGMLKMDFLALTTLTVIDDCLRSLRDLSGVEIDWSTISLSDEKTMALFGEGRTDAVFQFESSGMQEICRRLKPKELEDLSALNALYRPGPIDGGMIEDFIQQTPRREKGQISAPSDGRHPS